MTSKPRSTTLHAWELAYGGLYLLLERVAQRAAGNGERDRHCDAPAVDLDVAHHVELRHGLAQLRVDHMLERAKDGIAVDGHAAERTNGVFAPDQALPKYSRPLRVPSSR